MSSALTYIVLGASSFLVPQSVPNIAPISIPSITQGPLQQQVGHYNYTYTPGVGAHRVPTGVATWNSARRSCEEEGAYLAIINSVAEAEAIGQLLKKINAPYGYIGVHDFYQEDEFVTIHGESLVQTGYDGWRPGEPNNAGGNEDCVVVSSEGKLVDVSCEGHFNFICELPQVQSYLIQIPVRSRPAEIAAVIPAN